MESIYKKMFDELIGFLNKRKEDTNLSYPERSRESDAMHSEDSHILSYMEDLKKKYADEILQEQEKLRNSETITMKPFNLELAKQGHPVCTRDRRPARIICFDTKNVGYPIIALVEEDDVEHPYAFSVNGEYYIEGAENCKDLMMASIKHEGWMNIYRYECGVITSGDIHKSKEEAIAHKKQDAVSTIKIEWEEWEEKKTEVVT